MRALLDRLGDALERALERHVEAALAEGRDADLLAMLASIGVTWEGVERGGRDYEALAGPVASGVSGTPLFAFGIAYARGEAAALRRAAAALSSPGAKGREAEIIAALMRGASVADAARSSTQSAQDVTTRAKVVTLHPRGVTRDEGEHNA